MTSREDVFTLTSITLYIKKLNEIRQQFGLNFTVYTLFRSKEYCTISQSILGDAKIFATDLLCVTRETADIIRVHGDE